MQTFLFTCPSLLTLSYEDFALLFVLAGYKGVPIFCPFCPCSLLKDLAVSWPEVLPNPNKPWCIWSGVHPVPHWYWFGSYCSARVIRNIPVHAIGSLLYSGQVLPLLDTPCLSFPIHTRDNDLFPDHEEVLWSTETEAMSKIFHFSQLRAESWEGDELFPPTEATSCYTANSSVPSHTPWRRCQQYYSTVHSAGSTVQSSTHLGADTVCLQKSKFTV